MRAVSCPRSSYGETVENVENHRVLRRGLLFGVLLGTGSPRELCCAISRGDEDIDEPYAQKFVRHVLGDWR